MGVARGKRCLDRTWRVAAHEGARMSRSEDRQSLIADTLMWLGIMGSVGFVAWLAVMVLS